MRLEEITAVTQLGFPVLSVLIVLPLVASGVVFVLREERVAHGVAMAAVLASLVLSLLVLLRFDGGSGAVQFVEKVAWIPSIGVHYQLGLDGLSVLFVPLTAFVFFCVLRGSGEPRLYPRGYYASLLLLLSATMGIYAALDLVLFFCFFELALIPGFWLIRIWGVGADRQQAASRYLIYMLVGSLPLLLGFILLGVNHAQASGELSFDWVTLMATPAATERQAAIFLLMAIAFAIKGPALPFHTWMPHTAMAGPMAMGAYLLGLKVGLYGFLRFVLPLAPEASQTYAPWMAAVGLLAIVYAGAIAIVQANFRRLLVFSSISHVGLILVAAFSMNPSALQGALLLMVNAGIATAGLFVAAGFIQRRVGSTDVAALGGLIHRAPRLAGFTFIVGLALIGVPGTSGFVGELMAMSGAFARNWLYGAVAVLGVVLSACYFMWFFQRAFLGPVTRPAVARMDDLQGGERTVALTVLALVFVVGLMPRLLTSATEAAAQSVADRLAAAAPAVAVRSLAASDQDH